MLTDFLCFILYRHSHMNRKDSLEGSLDRVLLVAELEFPKILVLRLSHYYLPFSYKVSVKYINISKAKSSY